MLQFRGRFGGSVATRLRRWPGARVELVASSYDDVLNRIKEDMGQGAQSSVPASRFKLIEVAGANQRSRDSWVSQNIPESQLG